MKKTQFATYDTAMQAAAKRWMNLPQRATADVVFVAMHQGGAGLIPLAEKSNMLSVAIPFRLITCADEICRAIALYTMRDAGHNKLQRTTTSVRT